ncbi:MAG TPA: LPS export ABC transporter periplasmic protein LptC [Gammaproteobacteria bacterium]|nr:LPS export ABC transporter periplasmic protein LptC [Gammaproteobacteria bacterium]
MNPKLLALLGFLVLLAAGSWWLLRETALQGLQEQQPKTHVPDYYFTDATVTNLDLKGRPESELKAPRMIHHPDDDSVEVFQPRIRYFTKQGPPWYARADHGVEPSGGKLIYLDGHVQLTHPDENGGPPLVINTDRMTVNLDTNLATTDDSVIMTKGVSHETGVGMDGYMEDNRMVLRTDVKGYYVPKKQL